MVTGLYAQITAVAKNRLLGGGGGGAVSDEELACSNQMGGGGSLIIAISPSVTADNDVNK